MGRGRLNYLEAIVAVKIERDWAELI